MSFPKSENFRIITPLAVKTVMEKIRSFTKTANNKSKGKKIYSGFLDKTTFEITRKKNRKQYKSRIPLLPFMEFIPGFLKGEVHRGEAGETVVDVTIQSEEVVNGFHRLTWTLIKFSAIVIAAAAALLLLIIFLVEPVWTFDLRSVNRVKIGEGLGALIGVWMAVSLGFLAFDYLSVVKYKKRYVEIAAFEKREFTDLLEGKLQEIH